MSWKKNLYDNVQNFFIAIVLFALGIAAIIWPDFGEGIEINGRRGLMKQILVWVWGTPFGIICALLGAVGIYSSFKPRDPNDKDDSEYSF